MQGIQSIKFLKQDINYKQSLTLTAVAGGLCIRARVLPLILNIITNSPKFLEGQRKGFNNQLCTFV